MRATMKAMKSMKAMKAMKAKKTWPIEVTYWKDEEEVWETAASLLHSDIGDCKKVVAMVLELAAEHVAQYDEFNLLGLLKMKCRLKPATKTRNGVNPFTKEPCTFKAKPAISKVTVTATKKLKHMMSPDCK